MLKLGDVVPLDVLHDVVHDVEVYELPLLLLWTDNKDHMNGWCQDRLYDVDGSLSGKHYYSFSLLTLVMKSVMTLVISSAATP